MRMVDAFLSKRYRVSADFASTVTREVVRAGHTPILVLADDVPTHLATAVLAPHAQMSLYPRKEPKDRIPPAAHHVPAGASTRAAIPVAMGQRAVPKAPISSRTTPRR